MNWRFKADLAEIVLKHENDFSPMETLQRLQHVLNLEISNLQLHKRYQDDVFDLFERDVTTNKLTGEGQRLALLSRVVSSHSAKSCKEFTNSVTIQFAEENKHTTSFGDLCVPEQSRQERGTKRKPVGATLMHDVVSVVYEFSEQTVGSHSRPSGKSVLESPCKTINLTISMSRGAAALDKQEVLDFQMLTASFSPSMNRVLIDNDGHCSGDSVEEVVTDDDGGRSLDSGGAAENEDDEGEECEECEDRDDDTADYYSVSVDRAALQRLCDWLAYNEPAATSKRVRSSGGSDGILQDKEEDNDDEYQRRFAFYAENERCSELLMFLLSAPCVDDAWGVHTLVLVSGL